MSACMSGTRGSDVLSSTGDVLVRGDNDNDNDNSLFSKL